MSDQSIQPNPATGASGPPGLPLLGNMLAFNRDPLGFSRECARDYGDVVFFRWGPLPVYMFNHPHLIEEVLRKYQANLIKEISYRALRDVLGNGLLLSEGDVWKRHRRLVQPAFHQHRIVNYGQIVTECARKAAASWQDGESRDFHQEMMQLTLEIVAKTLFGTDITQQASQVSGSLDAILTHHLRQIQVSFLLPKWLLPGYRQARQGIAQLNALVYGIINQRRQVPGDDLLSMMLQATDEDGSQFSNRELRDEVMTLLLAGHETTAVSLSWTLMLLSRHPEAEAKLLQELQAFPSDREPTATELDQLPYTQAIIKESMRLYPPAWSIGREVTTPFELAGCYLEPGNLIFISQWSMHRDPRYFQSPEQFRPERWMNGEEQQLPQGAYFPFGDGPRACIGRGFALMEATLILATIARQFHFQLNTEFPIEPHPMLTLRPRSGMPMTATRRRGVS